MARRLLDPPRLLLLVAGLSTLLSTYSSSRWADYPFVDLLPISFDKEFLVIIGIVVLFLSEQIAQRKYTAWIVSTILLACLTGFSVFHTLSEMQTILYAFTTGFLVASRKNYRVRSDYTSIRRTLKLFGIQIAVIVLFFIGTVAVIDQREFGRNLTTGQTITITMRALTGEELPSYVMPTREDAILVHLLQLSIMLGGVIVLWNLFRPIVIRTSAHKYDVERARKILALYGDCSEDFFKLYPKDKHYFFLGDSFVSFTVSNGVALVLHGLAGRPSLRGVLRKRFVEYCRLNGWATAVVHCTPEEVKLWEKYDYKSIPIGQEAFVDVGEFLQQTRGSKHFRYVRNKAERLGLTSDVWRAPLSDHKVEILRQISEDWKRSGRTEYGFVMAPFDEEYIRSSDVVVVSDIAGTPIAYCNLIPQYQATTASIDHMRHRHDIPSIAMHYLLDSTIEHVSTSGYGYFNLGLAPLAKIEHMPKSYTQKSLVLLKRYASFYNFAGLEQFKNKFEPDWQPRFIVYENGLVGLAKTLQSLNASISIDQ